MKKVTSLAELRRRALTDKKYRQLAIDAAMNLGMPARALPSSVPLFESAMRWLGLNADETTEAGVVAEVNFCRPDRPDRDPGIAAANRAFNRSRKVED